MNNLYILYIYYCMVCSFTFPDVTAARVVLAARQLTMQIPILYKLAVNYHITTFDNHALEVIITLFFLRPDNKIGIHLIDLRDKAHAVAGI